jgi:hypothetical protein
MRGDRAFRSMGICRRNGSGVPSTLLAAPMHFSEPTQGRAGDSSDPECVLPLVNTEGLAGGYASTPDVLGLDEEHGIFPLGDLIADDHGNLSRGFAV